VPARSSKAPANRVRIIGGEWRSRVLRFADAPGLRPTPDRVRETLFNWLGQRLDGRSCLDLFAGSGALGFEAASRGAARVVMVESSRAQAARLRECAGELGAGPHVQVEESDALQFLRRSGERFDVVFVDPPYDSGLLDAVLERLPAVLAADALVYGEHRQPQAPAGWRVIKQGRAGRVHFFLATREEAQ